MTRAAVAAGPSIEALKAGDVTAFRALYEKYQRAVLATAYAVLSDWAVAEDTCQEVFLKVHRNIDRFQAGTNLKAWIVAIAHNTAIDASRRTRRTAELPEEVPAEVPDRDARRAFEDLLAPLSPGERVIVTLKDREDLAYQDIARITGKAEGSLRNLVSAALRKMRGALTVEGSRP